MSPVLQSVQDPSERSLFDRRAFTTLVRAMHRERRVAAATAGRLTVGAMDRQPDTTTAWIYGAYAVVLGRLPDPAGLATYEARLREGATPEDLVAWLTQSGEAAEEEAQLHRVFVTGAYIVALGRRPDMAGLHGYVEALRNGADHEALLHDLLQSQEARGQLRFPPTPPSAERQLARSVQETVMGSIDAGVESQLVTGARAGRSTAWMIWVTLRRRAGRRATLRLLVRMPLLILRSQRRAATDRQAAAVEAVAEWDWRVQRRLMDDVARLTREVAELQSTVRKG